MLRLDLAVLGERLGEDALPQIVGEAHRVALVAHGHAPAAVRARVLESGAVEKEIDRLLREHGDSFTS